MRIEQERGVMNTNNGFNNEYEFVKYLNGKKIKELNLLFQDLFEYLYPYESMDSTISCWRNHYPQKTDIMVKVNRVIKGISIKMGSRNSVHVEPISEFIHFLIENNISRESVIGYLKYHYADGTTNGSGGVRKSAADYKINHQAEIDKINKELKNGKLLKKAMDRFVLKGNNSEYSIDALIWGDVNDFLWLSKYDIGEIIMHKAANYSSSIHFSSLVVQPKNRCLNYNPKYEKDRYCIQVKWYSLFDDIIELIYIKNYQFFQADHVNSLQ